MTEETIYNVEQELNFFLSGRKPAIIPINKSSIIFKKLIGSRYPYCRGKWMNMPIFFQTEELMYAYLDHVKGGLEPDMNFVTGIHLGYPPRAVNIFLERMDWGLEHRTYISYGGLYFASFTDHLEKDIEWLKEKYNLHKGEQIKVQRFNPYRVTIM